MLTRIDKKIGCTRCIRSHCVNKGHQNAKQDYSCYQASGCASCNLHSVCASPTKDSEIFELSSRVSNSWDIPCCYVKPTCENCFKSSHCQNAGTKSFELNLEEPANPTCFSKYHSIKWFGEQHVIAVRNFWLWFFCVLLIYSVLNFESCAYNVNITYIRRIILWVCNLRKSPSNKAIKHLQVWKLLVLCIKLKPALFPQLVMAKIGSAMLGNTIAANKPQKSSRNESFLFYAFFQNASYPLCASYKSNLLVTS